MPQSECECASVSKCDIFDFMAKHVGLTVIHPGGYQGTEHLLHSLNVGALSKVLDIACGKGTSALYIAQKYGCRVMGVDISSDLIEQAKSLAKAKGLSAQVEFLVGDAQALPFEDNTFDVAVSQAMLVLIEDKVKAIKEARRVLRKGGTGGWLELSWRAEPDEEFLRHVTDVLCSYCMRRAETYDGWKNTFAKAGIRDLEVGKYSFENGGVVDMIKDEGIRNTLRVFSRYLTDGEVRRRMNLISDTFREYPQYFGYGTYSFTKN